MVMDELLVNEVTFNFSKQKKCRKKNDKWPNNNMK